MSGYVSALIAFAVLVSVIGMTSCDLEPDGEEPGVIWITPLSTPLMPTPWIIPLPTKTPEMVVRPTPRPPPQMVRHTPTPVRRATTPDIVRAANDYIGSDSVRVSRNDMVLYCESFRDMGWDLMLWYDLTDFYIELADPTPAEYLSMQTHFDGVLVGMESVSGRAEDGCAVLGVR